MARQRAVLLDAHTHLDGRDPVLDLLMATHGPARLPSPAPSNRRFHDLAESIAYQKQQAEARAGRRLNKPSADGEFVTAFDNALAKAHGLQRMEAARTVAKATAHFLCGHIEGTTIARLANIYVRYGSKTARNAGARLARAMAADPHSVRDPLSILEHRCKEATT